ncbi:T9SS type A sorting domain-containing protein [Winogradskyella wichelsiae]|uniref:T9SS type A sorting domain-containing protein n=1 Tax=Winogradskyella wichelsiae TaxID=2697007 RepID=UPI003EF7CBD0
MKKLFILIAFITLLQNTYSQQFTENTEINLTGILYGEAKWIDIDKTGKDELLISGYDTNYEAFSALYSYQSGNIGLLPITIDPYYFSSIGKLDYNNDGVTDFIIIGYNASDEGISSLYVSDGNGSYTVQNINIPGTTNGKIKIEDLNNDGLDDIIITGTDDSYDNIAKLYLQNMEGEFIESTVPFFGNTYSSITTFDANNDGNIDVLLTGFSSNYIPESKLYINDGTAVFTESTAVLADVYFSTSSAADYDNDGDIDILISGFNSSYAPYTVLYNNDEHGNFTENTTVTLEQLYWGASNFVDYDNDGDLDLFLSGADSNTVPHAKFYKNTNGILYEDTNAEIGIYGTYVSSADWTDYDNDGDLDFVLSGLNTDNEPITKVYTNQQESLSIDDFANKTQLSIYPNPTTDKTVNLIYDKGQLSSSLNTIKIYSSIGQKVYQTSLNTNSGVYNKSLDLSSLASGIYVLQFTSGNTSVTKKLVLK